MLGIRTNTWLQVLLALAAAGLVASCAGGSGQRAVSQASPSTTAKQSAPVAAEGATLAAVKARGRLKCGVNPGLAGFGMTDSAGAWVGFDVDYCRAVASAIFGDRSKVEFIPVSTEQRFVALQSGEIDLLARNSVATLSRDTQLGLDAVAITFYDGQGFLVRRDRGFRSIRELRGGSVCVLARTTTEWNLMAYSATSGLNLSAVLFQDSDQAFRAYDAGDCDALTADSTYLVAVRTAMQDPAAHVVLPELISKEPLSLMVREGDNGWADIVRWTHFVMLNAEELGVTSANATRLSADPDPNIRLLLGGGGNLGAGLGLTADWAIRIIAQVGNYGEVFERNLGSLSPLGMERGPNRLWKDGGLQFAPPIR